MELNSNNILLFVLILVVPVYLFMSRNNTSNPLINQIKSILGIAIVHPENRLKGSINDSAISSVNYQSVGGEPIVNIIRNKGKVTGESDIYYKPQYIPKDTMSANDLGSTEYRFAQYKENIPSKAWVDYNISQFPGYYKSDFSSNIYDLKQFFDKENVYREVPDNRLYYDSVRPACPSCYTDVNGTSVCDFNSKLERVPKSLYNVGPQGNTSLQKIQSSEIDTISNDHYLAYNYENDKAMNGANFYNDVQGVIYNESTTNPLKSSTYTKNDVQKCL